MISKKILVYTGAAFALIIGLANSGQHPVTSNSGYTNAPGDSVCSQCHSGNSNFDGEITISGLPSTIMTGNTYNITVTVTNPNGNADKAGFQLLALNGTNANAGNLTNNMPSANTSIRMVSGGKKYFGHLNAMNFPASNELSYTVDWTAPATTGSNPVIKFYAAAVIANGNGQTNLDRVATTSLEIPIQGPATGVSASITNVQNILCAGANTGSALAVASGGTSPYGYNWSNGVMVAQNNTLPAGTATVTITDAAGTTATASTTITAPPVLNASASSSPACSGGNNGSAFASGSGGSGTLSYFWSNNVAGQSNNNLFAGTYTVTVTDSNGCTKSSTTTVTSLPALTVATSATATACGNNNGSITTSVGSGTPPYTYAWTGGLTGQNPVNVSAGTYTVTVTQTSSGCTGTSVATVNGSIGLTVTPAATPTSCGAANGSINLTVSGGTAPFSYNWTGGLTGQNPTSVAAGTYTVTVTASGAGACTKVTSVTVNASTGVQVSTLLTQPSCGQNNGSISVSASGGTLPYSYTWTGGLSGFNPVNVAPGTYTVTVADAGSPSCTSVKTVTLNPSTAPMLSGSVTNESCVGAGNGSITLTTTSGTPGYTYSWSNGATVSGLTSLPSGQYTVTVTDAAMCTASSSFTVAANASFSLQLISKTNIICFGDSTGSITVGASQPLTYSWSNNQTGSTISNIPAGIYTAVGSDNAGCQSLPLTVSITQPPAIQALTTSFDNILCPGDSNAYFNVNLVGGTGSLSYQWSMSEPGLSPDSLAAGTYTITVTDMNGCSEIFEFTAVTTDTIAIDTFEIISPDCYGGSGAILLDVSGGYGVLDFDWSPALPGTDSLYNLEAGNYTVTISDEADCMTIDSFAVLQPDSLLADLQVQNESVAGANDGIITANPQGGTGPYSILWNNGYTTFTIDSLSPGLYSYVLTDANDCSASGWGVVGGGGCSLLLEYSLVSPSCFNTYDGEIQLTINGTFTEYDIQLFRDNVPSDLPLDSLTAGKYTIIVSDSNQCIAILPVINLTPVHPAIVLDSLIKTHPTSPTSKDGGLEVIISGGDGSLNYEWTKNGAVIGTGTMINGLEAGIYGLIVTDEQGCQLELNSILLEVKSNTLQSEKEGGLSIHPNPFIRTIALKNESALPATHVKVVDITGKLIFIYPELRSGESVILEPATDNLVKEGIYILSFFSGNKVYTRKLIRMGE